MCTDLHAASTITHLLSVWHQEKTNLPNSSLPLLQSRKSTLIFYYLLLRTTSHVLKSFIFDIEELNKDTFEQSGS